MSSEVFLQNSFAKPLAGSLHAGDNHTCQRRIAAAIHATAIPEPVSRCEVRDRPAAE